MKLLSALNFEDIEEYIKCLPGISTIDIVGNKKELLDTARSGSYDLVLISKELPGSEKMEYLIEAILSEKLINHRIVYIYGEYDGNCDDFIRFLIEHEVYDFYVGDEISSKDIERLIFRPTGKETAFSYFRSSFNNEQYFSYKSQSQKEKRQFLNDRLEKSGLRPFLKTKSNKGISLEKLIISIISNQATGKSHTAWNLGSCLSKRGYATSLINIDRGYSANLFFDIDEIYYDLLDFSIQNGKHMGILDNCFKRKNLSIITGRLGDEKEISIDDFIKLLYGIRTKSDITIIDTKTGLTDLTRAAIKSSTYDLLIFDCDIMHFHMNMNMLYELRDDFIAEKTIAVINNTNVKSSSHKFIYNELISSGIPFKDIVFITSCGFLSNEAMHTGISPYQAAGEEYKNFARDIDNILDKLGTKPGRNGFAEYIFRK